jgi:hypothetical protein
MEARRARASPTDRASAKREAQSNISLPVRFLVHLVQALIALALLIRSTCTCSSSSSSEGGSAYTSWPSAWWAESGFERGWEPPRSCMHWEIVLHVDESPRTQPPPETSWSIHIDHLDKNKEDFRENSIERGKDSLTRRRYLSVFERKGSKRGSKTSLRKKK